MNVNTPMIKLCGIRDRSTAYQVAQLDADYLGIVFHPTSKRYVSVNEAQPIVQAIFEGGAKPVAVFTHHSGEQMLSICRTLGIHYAQLHGSRSREEHHLLPRDIHRIYVLSVDREGVVVNSDAFEKTLDIHRDYLLFDSLEGGSGETIPNYGLSFYAGGFQYFLAGGLSSKNVCELMNTCNAYGVDVSSGIEDKEGNKVISKIRKFIDRVRARGESA